MADLRSPKAATNPLEIKPKVKIAKIPFPPGMREELERTADLWIELADESLAQVFASFRNDHNQLRIGDSVEFNGRILHVVHCLGIGGQGTVYLVNDDGHIRELKILKKSGPRGQGIVSHVEAIKAMSEDGASSLRFMEIDPRANAFLAEWDKGVNLNLLLNLLGRPVDRLRVSPEFRQWLRLYLHKQIDIKTLTKFVAYSANIILTVDGDLVWIDTAF